MNVYLELFEVLFEDKFGEKKSWFLIIWKFQNKLWYIMIAEYQMVFIKNELDLFQLICEDCWVRKVRSGKYDFVEVEEVWVESKDGRSEEIG